MKSDRKRIQKEEEEMEKRTKFNAGAVKTSLTWILIRRFTQHYTQIGEFVAMVSTQHKQKENHVKTATREKK